MLTAVDHGWIRPFHNAPNAEVYHVALTPNASREAACAGWLDRSEAARAARFLYPGPRRRYVLLRASIRALLCDRLSCANGDLSFASAEHGKPYAVVGGTPADIQFNLSDSGAHGLIAIARAGRIGIDVEERSDARDIDGLAATVFGREEQAHVTAARGRERVRRFYRLWTVKEALLKALGTGLYLDVSSFQVPDALLRGEAAAEFQFPHLPEARWRVEDLGTEDFAAAMAHEIAPEPESASRGEVSGATLARGLVRAGE